ncbi:MAG: hypothetical protein AABX89_05365 [Candidatus Thermoplasmatota archaeon]
MTVAVTERLWLTQPRKATVLAKVVAARGEWAVLDRTVLAPESRSHRHPQPHDQGTLWARGEKRRVDRVVERDGGLWHRVVGASLQPGDEVNLHLDPDRRLLTSRAHTALHLLLPGLAAAGARMVADPVVKGGGTVRFEFADPIAPAVLAALLERANGWVAANIQVAREHATRDALHDVTPQLFHPPNPTPGPDPLELVRIAGVGCYPCDGTHVERTGLVGRIVIAQAARNRDRFVLVAKVK